MMWPVNIRMAEKADNLIKCCLTPIAQLMILNENSLPEIHILIKQRRDKRT